jgi:hypothetical protein
MIASHTGAQTRMGQRNDADINAAPTQKTTIASGGTRQRSSSRKQSMQLNIATIGDGAEPDRVVQCRPENADNGGVDPG